jgi:hypothetical protein
MLKKALAILAAVFVVVTAMIGQRYYAWAAQSDSPFDEVGIELHRYMPAAVQNWGCAKLSERFGGKTLPPYGCQDLNDPKQWRKTG